MISLMQRIDTNIVAAVLLVCTYRVAAKRLDRNDKVNRQFLDISVVIFFLLCAETLACIVNKRPEKWLIPVALVSNDVLFILAPVLGYRFNVFVHSWISPNKSSKLSKNKLILLPLLLDAILCLANLFNGLIFQITDSNVYQRGILYFVPFVITYIYMLWAFFFVYENRKKMLQSEFIPLILFGLFPAVGAVIQAMFYGVLLMWSSTAGSFVMVYIFIQQRMMQLDPLTGAWTKGSFENHVEEIACKSNKENLFGIIFIDLDKFKHINDTYGHLEGDSALKTSVRLIKSSIRQTDIVARFGGDEFVVIIHHTSEDEIRRVVARIFSNISKYNLSGEKIYRLEYSVGYGIYHQNGDVWQFINYVDHKMYQNKNKKQSHSL